MDNKIILEGIIKKMVNEIIDSSKDIVITIPSTTNWGEYQKEINAVEDYSQEMNFKVSNFPKNTKIGNKCYL